MSDKYPGTNVFNVEHLRRYRQSPIKFGERTILPETRAHKPASEEYQVELGGVGHCFAWQGYSSFLFVKVVAEAVYTKLS
jgi:hypothetical protein